MSGMSSLLISSVAPESKFGLALGVRVFAYLQKILNPSVWRSLENQGAELVRRKISVQWEPASPPSVPGDQPLVLRALRGVLPQRECCRFRYQRERGSHGRRAGSGRWVRREVLLACGSCRESLDGRNLSRDP